MTEHKLDHLPSKETDKAWLVSIKGVKRWIPKSVGFITEKLILHVPEWFDAKMDKSGALFSDDKTRKYMQYRNWGTKDNILLCIGLNPVSDKDSAPTIERLCAVASHCGYDGMIMCNLFTTISDTPKALLDESVAEHEKADLGIIFGYSIGAKDIIFCWGSFPQARDRAQKVIDFYSNGLCFGKNKDGSPWHPMALHYAGLTHDKVRLKNFREHEYTDNTYNRRITAKEKQREYNATQYQMPI